MESKKIKNSSQLITYILIILGFVVVANYLSSFLFTRADLTEKKAYSVSKATKTMLKKLDDIVNIQVCFSKNLPPQLKQLQSDVRDLLSEYKAYSGKNLLISYIDPSTSDSLKRKVTELGVPEIQMQTYEKDKAQVINGFMGIIIQYNAKKEVLPIVQNLNNLEYDLTQAIMKVSRKTVPQIAVAKMDSIPSMPPQMMQRNPQQNPEELRAKYKPIFENLEKNYQVNTVEVLKGEALNSENKTCIIPGGGDMSDKALYEIDQYFMKGGNLIVLTEPIKVSFSYGAMAMPQSPSILRLLEHYGAKVERDLVLDASCGQVQIPQQVGPFQMNVPVNYPYFVKVIPEGLNKNIPAVASIADMVLPWTSSISLTVPNRDSASVKGSDSVKVKGTVLVKSSKKSWITAGNFDLNPQQKWMAPPEGFKQSNLMVYLSGSFTSYFAGKPAPVDQSTNTPINTADMAASNSKGNLIVAGSTQFLSAQFGMPGNVTWLQNVVDWLSADENLIQIRTRNIVDRSIRKDELKDASATSTVVRYTNLLLMPLCVIIIGIVIFLKRKGTVKS
jgi:ABC-2 type transport system permease protein